MRATCARVRAALSTNHGFTLVSQLGLVEPGVILAASREQLDISHQLSDMLAV